MDPNILLSTEQKQHLENCTRLVLAQFLQPATQIFSLIVIFGFLKVFSLSHLYQMKQDEVKMIIQRRLTEIFGCTPGPGLALAQGEAALSA